MRASGSAGSPPWADSGAHPPSPTARATFSKATGAHRGTVEAAMRLGARLRWVGSDRGLLHPEMSANAPTSSRRRSRALQVP